MNFLLIILQLVISGLIEVEMYSKTVPLSLSQMCTGTRMNGATILP